MASEPAPIAYFAFDRPEHARRTLAALAANPLAARSILHVFVDGPRDERDRAAVQAVLAEAQAVRGFREVRVYASEVNRGLYAAITGGVSAVLEQHERVIVVEDDILTSTHFLAYMNEALSRYATEPRVACIHGFAPPLPGLPEYFFLPGGDCWGWATWRDRWQLFRPDAIALLREVLAHDAGARFSASHGWGSLLMLARRVQGRNQSWAILWHASLFLRHCLTLHPGRSFVGNIGLDGSGTHSATSEVYASALREQYQGLPPLRIAADEGAGRRLGHFMDGVADDGRPAWRRWTRRVHAQAVARLVLLTARAPS